MIHYQYDAGHQHYLMVDGDHVLDDFPVVGVAYSYWISDGEPQAVLHKHGSEERVSKWLEDARKKYVAGGIQEMADQLFMISSDSLSVDVLNRMIDTTGYLLVVLKELGIHG